MRIRTFPTYWYQRRILKPSFNNSEKLIHDKLEIDDKPKEEIKKFEKHPK